MTDGVIPCSGGLDLSEQSLDNVPQSCNKIRLHSAPPESAACYLAANVAAIQITSELGVLMGTLLYTSAAAALMACKLQRAVIQPPAESQQAGGDIPIPEINVNALLTCSCSEECAWSGQRETRCSDSCLPPAAAEPC